MMSDVITIELKQLVFFAHHGLYPEERKLGNEFEINLFVSYKPVSGTVTDISDTANYVQLYDLLKAEMQKPRDLLETFVMELTGLIHSSFSAVKKIEISITKLHPPIAKFTGTVGITYTKEYIN